MLQEFNLEIRGKKGSENVVADQLSRLDLDEKHDDGAVHGVFPNEQLFAVKAQIPWYATLLII